MSGFRRTPRPDWRLRRDTREDLQAHGNAPHERVDLGLELLAMRAKPGVGFTRYDIAAWCGCTDANIYRLERRALVKLGRALTAGGAVEALGKELR